jgi:steroid 5-alpha reductase family enzyme
MSFLDVYLNGALAILALMTIVWLLSLALHNSSIVDIFWGPGFVVTSWLYFALTPDGFAPRKMTLAVLVTIWGLRLGIHILRRNWDKPEDFRYAKWREEEGTRWWWFSFFKVFLLQGLLMWAISAPLLAAQISATPAELTILDYGALVVWSIGFIFEALGDMQLARFKAEPANKGKVLNTGLWRYTRHPNYFGDAVQWWGYYLLALAAGGWWTVFSPALMTLLLVRVSGVALLERTLSERPGYREYVEATNAFLPWLPRRPS